jgi:hypothetical protein
MQIEMEGVVLKLDGREVAQEVLRSVVDAMAHMC